MEEGDYINGRSFKKSNEVFREGEGFEKSVERGGDIKVRLMSYFCYLPLFFLLCCCTHVAWRVPFCLLKNDSPPPFFHKLHIDP